MSVDRVFSLDVVNWDPGDQCLREIMRILSPIKCKLCPVCPCGPGIIVLGKHFFFSLGNFTFILRVGLKGFSEGGI